MNTTHPTLQELSALPEMDFAQMLLERIRRDISDLQELETCDRKELSEYDFDHRVEAVEAGTDNDRREVLAKIATQRTHRLGKLRLAKARVEQCIKNSDYDFLYCNTCWEEIDRRRLYGQPTTTHCGPCKEAEEIRDLRLKGIRPGHQLWAR